MGCRQQSDAGAFGRGPRVIALTKGVVAGSANLLIALLLGARLPSIGATGAALVVGFCGVGLSLVLFVLALRHLGAARTGAYFSLAPFLGAVIAIGLLGEPITSRLIVAGLLMAFGVWLHLTERHAHEHGQSTTSTVIFTTTIIAMMTKER
jgi:drug/metabolite transporter (DMT)-like permease